MPDSLPVHLLWRLRFLLTGTVVALQLIGCATVRQVKPLRQGESSLSASLGGPVTQVGSLYFPIPMLGLYYNRCLIDRTLDIGIGTNLTQALYGVLNFESGVNWHPLEPQGLRPGLLVSPRLFIMTDFSPNGLRIYPDLSLSSLWEVRPDWFIYTGLDNWFELATTRTDGNQQQHNWLITPHLGLSLGNARTQLQIETKLFTPNLSNTSKPTKNIGIGDHGIWGVFIGMTRVFGRTREFEQ